APSARQVQLHGLESHLRRRRFGVFGDCAISGEQRQLLGSPAPFVKGIDDPAPGFPLAVVDLSQVENLSLYDLATRTAFALDNIPIEMLFAVLQPSIAFQIHAVKLKE